MATWVFPPIPPDQLKIKEDESLERELAWLLESLQEALVPLREGLEECVALLAPKEPGSTLVLSSLRSESVKGFVTRVGMRLVKGDINLRLSSLAPNVPRGTPTYPSTHYTITPSSTSTASSSTSTTTSSSTNDLTLPPLLNLSKALSAALSVIDTTRRTGRATSAPFIANQLRLLIDHLATARRCLKGPSLLALSAEAQQSQAQSQQDQQDPNPHRKEDSNSSNSSSSSDWTTQSVPPHIFTPPLHPNLSLHFSIYDSSLVLTVRTVSPLNPDSPGSISISNSSSIPNTTLPEFSLSGFNLRDRLSSLSQGLGLPLGGSGSGRGIASHDEVGEVFKWRGGTSVQVREKVRVESSGDPSLISVAAKLSALEHECRRWQGNLGVVMGIITMD